MLVGKDHAESLIRVPVRGREKVSPGFRMADDRRRDFRREEPFGARIHQVDLKRRPRENLTYGLADVTGAKDVEFGATAQDFHQ